MSDVTVYLTCAVIGLGGRGAIKTWTEVAARVRLYMLTSDLTSLVPPQFSHWLQVTKVGTVYHYYYFLFFFQLWEVYGKRRCLRTFIGKFIPTSFPLFSPTRPYGARENLGTRLSLYNVTKHNWTEDVVPAGEATSSSMDH